MRFARSLRLQRLGFLSLKMLHRGQDAPEAVSDKSEKLIY